MVTPSANGSFLSLSFTLLPYSAKFSRAVNFADFANSNSIAKIIFVKIIIIINFLRPQLILTTNVAGVVVNKNHTQLVLRGLF